MQSSTVSHLFFPHPTFTSPEPVADTMVRVVRGSQLPSELYGTQFLSSLDGRNNSKSIFIEHFLGARHHSFSEQPYKAAIITLILQVKKQGTKVFK